MKKTTLTLALTFLIFLLSGCGRSPEPAKIAATTLPVYEFTARICEGTGITVTRLVTEEVSCLHDYSLNVRQVKAAEAAELIVISGAGMEEFMEDILHDAAIIDASAGLELLCPPEEAEHDHDHEEGHHHDVDPHIWLDPSYAAVMARNIFLGLSGTYPEYAEVFSANLEALTAELAELDAYGKERLKDLSCREMITFHDGFAYFAQAFDLTILETVEEESGSEASARELIHLIEEVRHHGLPAVFTERNGSTSAAAIIAAETGAVSSALDMAMSGNSYFDAMYHNIDTVKEALQ